LKNLVPRTSMTRIVHVENRQRSNARFRRAEACAVGPHPAHHVGSALGRMGGLGRGKTEAPSPMAETSVLKKCWLPVPPFASLPDPVVRRNPLTVGSNYEQHNWKASIPPEGSPTQACGVVGVFVHSRINSRQWMSPDTIRPTLKESVHRTDAPPACC